MVKEIMGNKSFFRFCIIGGCATLIDFILYMLLSKGMNVIFAKMVSMGCSMTFSYIFNRIWSFKSSGEIKKEICKYLLVQLINLSVNVLTNYVVLICIGNKVISFIVATIVAMVVNYLLQKRVVFINKKDYT